MIMFGLHLETWTYSFKTTIQLINRSPFSTLSSKSHFEILYKTKSNYSNTRIYRCLCYPYNHAFSTSKLDLKSIPYMFLKYSKHQRDSILLTPLLISPYVIFDEIEFSYLYTYPTLQRSKTLSSFVLLDFNILHQLTLHFVDFPQSNGRTQKIYDFKQHVHNVPTTPMTTLSLQSCHNLFQSIMCHIIVQTQAFLLLLPMYLLY